MTAGSDRRWRQAAACRDQPTRRFTQPDGPDDLAAAQTVCGRCPVRRPCLTVALAQPADADIGIWAGTTPAIRRRIRDGQLTVSQVLRTPAGPSGPSSRAASRTTRDVRQASPQVTVSRDRRGDYTDVDGRVVIFRIHGQPPWMLMVDHRCIARTDTVRAAARVAWTRLHRNNVATRTARRAGPARR